MQTIGTALAVYSWVIIGVLTVFLWKIAYFYEKTSGERVYHSLAILPAVLLLLGAIWYLVTGDPFVGQPVADICLFLGGAGIAIFGMRLQTLMTGEHR